MLVNFAVIETVFFSPSLAQYNKSTVLLYFVNQVLFVFRSPEDAMQFKIMHSVELLSATSEQIVNYMQQSSCAFVTLAVMFNV